MFIRRVLPGLALCCLVISVWYSVLLSRADAYFREDTLASAQEAVRLAPSNAAYHSLLAELIQEEGGNPDAELEIATKLSPHESRYWIRRAFRAEVEQKYDAAEQYLTDAYRVDRGFDPRWALMNYYFRRSRFPEFWKYAGQALEMSYGDLQPIFRLCLAADDDPSRTRQILPPRRNIRLAFFSYLVQHNQLASTAGMADELASGASLDDVPLLVDYCARQMGHNDKSSLVVWNALCRRHLVPFSELDPDHGQLVTNGDFSAVPYGQGFDWKYGTGAGVKVSPINTGQGVSVEITGDQPDSALLLEEPIPLTRENRYVISYEYRLVGTQPDSGLHWVVRGAAPRESADVAPIANSSELSATEWKTGQMTFSPGQRDAARLVLEYRRQPGIVRWKGTVQIRRVVSALAEPDSKRETH